MKPHAQAVRDAQAWERILAAAKMQAAANGVEATSLDATHRDPALQRLFRMEALAGILEQVGQAKATEGAGDKAAPKQTGGKR